MQTVDLSQESAELLRTEAAGYAAAALANIRHEFPAAMQHTMTAPGDFPYRPRARTPVFYGSFDWHSSVQMHWALLRLLRTAPGAVPGAEIRSALRAQLTPVALAAEAEFAGSADAQAERPQGWGWALALIHEAQTWDDPDARKWAEAMAPLAEALAARPPALAARAVLPGALRHGAGQRLRAVPGLALRRGPGPRRATRRCATRSRPGPWRGSARTACTRPTGSLRATTVSHPP